MSELYRPPRRKVFVSYHHGGDQAYYDRFSADFHDGYEAITDNSLERRVDSGDVDYVMRRIRETNLAGSSTIIVLCGSETPKRKYVDWELYAALNQKMAVLGIGLPTLQVYPNGGTDKPARLQDNITNGYGEWTNWREIAGNPVQLTAAIERANARAKSLIDNSRARMARNGL
jgi:hypothetical protein